VDIATILNIMHHAVDVALALCLVFFMRSQIKINEANYRMHKHTGEIADGHQKALTIVHEILGCILAPKKSEPEPTQSIEH
jgi:hypothetical protein